MTSTAARWDFFKQAVQENCVPFSEFCKIVNRTPLLLLLVCCWLRGEALTVVCLTHARVTQRVRRLNTHELARLFRSCLSNLKVRLQEAFEHVRRCLALDEGANRP